MASFEQNQQNQVNMNNSIDQIKQWQAEWDKAAASIGDAELEAEEELLGVRLKNLTKAQQAKLTQLGQLLELEEKGIQELAKLKLTLSNRQFAIRKQEIQKEFQLYKTEAENFYKSISKYKVTTPAEAPKKASTASDIKASTKNKAADAAIQKADKKVQTATYSIDKLRQDITDTISSLQELTEATITQDIKNASANSPQRQTTSTNNQENRPAVKTDNDVSSQSPVSETDATPQEVKAATPTKETPQSFSNDGMGHEDKVDIGENAPEKVLANFNKLLGGYLESAKEQIDALHKKGEQVNQSAAPLEVRATDKLNKVFETVKDEAGNETYKASQETFDIASRLLDGISAAEKAEKELNTIKGDSEEAKLNRSLILAEEEYKLRTQHANKEQELIEKGIAAQAKANDLLNNREQYALEARLALQDELDERQNRNAEKSIGLEERLAFIRENRDKLLAEEKKERDNQYAEEYTKHLLKAGDYAISLEEYKADQERKRQNAAKKEAVNGMVDGLKKFGTGEFSMADVKKSYGEYMGQRTAELQDQGLDENSAKLSAQFELLAEAAGSLAKALDAKVKEISSMQGIIDTRLQGSQTNERDFGNGSYWNQLLEDAKKIAGASPFIKQEKLVDNIKTLVEKGISFDIKQRAFLMTIQEKIANTFDVADGTLLRLIRIQQQDTTAGRLGMESALNSFLNSMYETSEYLESVAKSVRSSLEEMQALMEGAAGAEVEFQVQKWMGSLYSVGMSDSAVQDIAKAFGQIASGDVSGLTGSGTGNLLIMAANEAGMSIADILQEGLDAKETNQLMQAMVNYLAEIAETSSDSRVVQQQLANVYGMKASDLKAATNLASSIKDISKQDLTYSGMMGQLNHMMNTIRFRTSIGEGMTNMWDNVMYSMASTQASNPILYLLPKMANLLKDVTGGDGGGISLPFLNVHGFGVDLNTSVADLMMVASMAGTALGALGPAITGLTDLVNPLVGSTMLIRAGINPLGKVPVLARGSATPLQNIRGASISESGQIVGNSSGDDVKNATMQDAEDSKKKQMVEAKEEETADDTAMKADLAVVNIYNLLEEVAHGSQSLRVRLVGGPNGGAPTLNCNCNHAGGQDPLNANAGNGSTTAGSGAGISGTDNGNWVLAF